jgi:hypothetical protein
MKYTIVLLYSWAEGKPLSHSENDKGGSVRQSRCEQVNVHSEISDLSAGPLGGEKGEIDPDYVGLPHFEGHRAIVHTCRHCGVVS